jgi:hypothetical protein
MCRDGRESRGCVEMAERAEDAKVGRDQLKPTARKWRRGEEAGEGGHTNTNINTCHGKTH